MAQSIGVPQIISSRFCAPYPIDIAIVRKVMTLAEANFDVTDIDGNIILKVEQIRPTFLHERMIIRDPSGNPIITLRDKAMSIHSKWHAFRGESIDSKDLLFTVKTHSLLSLKTKLDVFLASNTAEKVCDFQLKGSLSDRACTIYAGNDKSGTVVAQMHKKHTAKSIFLGKDNFVVTVNPNVDYAFMTALIVILDALNRQAAVAASSGADAASSGAAASAAAAASC